MFNGKTHYFSMAIFNSYVSLPEGKIIIFLWFSYDVPMFLWFSQAQQGAVLGRRHQDTNILVASDRRRKLLGRSLENSGSGQPSQGLWLSHGEATAHRNT